MKHIKQKMQVGRGFTLVELIIVIAIIAILAGAIFVAIDPARRLHEARNARRASDVVTILEAIKKMQVDNDGSLLPEIAALTNGLHYMVGEGVECSSCTTAVITACADLSEIPSNYLAVIPADPKSGTSDATGYYLLKDSNNAITIGACEAEGEEAGGGGTPPTITVTR